MGGAGPAPPASAEALAAGQQQLGIGPSTAVCQWGGEQLDYALAIDGILDLEPDTADCTSR